MTLFAVHAQALHAIMRNHKKCIDTSASQHDNARALRRVIRLAPSPNKPRHMDVYPSRNVDTCSLRVPAPHNNLNAFGDRMRSAGAFLD
jgi:hypothetical protein